MAIASATACHVITS